MTTQIASITPENLPQIAYQGKAVITTELLATQYGTDSNRIRKNHQRNTAKFQTGKHFFKLEGEELSVFKTLCPHIGKNAQSLMLWTERGAARHAKILDTEQAWEVFEKLEDAYFHRDTRPAPANQPETITLPLADHIALQAKVIAFQEEKIERLERENALPRPAPNHGKPYSPEEDALMLQLRKEGWGAYRTAKRMGRTFASVQSRLRKLDRDMARREAA